MEYIIKLFFIKENILLFKFKTYKPFFPYLTQSKVNERPSKTTKI